MEYKGRNESPSYTLPHFRRDPWRGRQAWNWITSAFYVFSSLHSPIGQLVHLSLLSTNFLDFDSCQISCYLFSWTWWSRSWNFTFSSDVIVKQRKSTKCWSLLLLFAFLFIHETFDKSLLLWNYSYMYILCCVSKCGIVCETWFERRTRLISRNK